MYDCTFCIFKMEDLKRFLLKFALNAKFAVNKEFESIYKDVKIHTKEAPQFPEIFIIKFEKKEFGLVDLDSPIQLMNRQSNVLMIVENDTQQNRLEESSNSPRST